MITAIHRTNKPSTIHPSIHSYVRRPCLYKRHASILYSCFPYFLIHTHTYPPKNLSTFSSIPPSIHPSIRPSIHLSIHLSVRPSVSHSLPPPSLNPSTHLFNYPSNEPTTSRPIPQSIRLSIYKFIVFLTILSYFRYTTKTWLSEQGGV